jgi:hypothetical protein
MKAGSFFATGKNGIVLNETIKQLGLTPVMPLVNN